MVIATILGTIGAFLILLAFILQQRHVWEAEDLKYDGVNLIGGLCLVIYAVMLKSYPFLILNGVWAIISLRDVVQDILRLKK